MYVLRVRPYPLKLYLTGEASFWGDIDLLGKRVYLKTLKLNIMYWRPLGFEIGGGR